MKELEFKGIKVEYDERCVLSYKWQKAMNSPDQGKVVSALERLFLGKDEEIADKLNEKGEDGLDDSMEAMGELLKAVLEDMGRVAKN